MEFTHLRLQNWRNFLSVDVELRRRMFLVGPNASGKSNLLDVFRFLRDVADPQGGLQSAIVGKRRGVSQLRSLHARQYSDVEVSVRVRLDEPAEWEYTLQFSQDNRSRPVIRRELVRLGEKVVLDRPDPADKADPTRLSQTYLEQVNANRDFRALQAFFTRINYLHIVPQLIREPDRSVRVVRDPYGSDFLEQVASTQPKTLQSRLRRITQALRVAVPQLREVQLERDARGVPHLKGLYAHWRKGAGWQREDQFSDGTLRLMGLLWALLDGSAPLLLEEPELSLHTEVVKYIPSMMARLARKSGRQILVSTHSLEMLDDPGIAVDEIMLLMPTDEDTKVIAGSRDWQLAALVAAGVPVGRAAIPRAAPKNPQQLALFE